MKKLLTNGVTSVSKVLTSGKIGITNSEEVQRVKLATSQYNVFLFQCDVIEVVFAGVVALPPRIPNSGSAFSVCLLQKSL